MKKIGIIGGVGWPSTAEYYRLICEESQQYHSGETATEPCPIPEFTIESLNINFTANHRGSSDAGSWDQWDSYYNDALHRLENSGAEFIIIASVTPHNRLNNISNGTTIPVYSIFEAISDECKINNISNLLVLGTAPTMASSALPDVMKERGIAAQYPRTAEQKNEIVSVISQLYENNRNLASEAIEKTVRQSLNKHELATTAVCLACTELPLAFSGFEDLSFFTHNGIQYINSSVAHARLAFQQCLN